MPQAKHPGRPRSKNFNAIRSRIVQLKSTVNPKTGKPYTFAEIGKILGMSAMGACRYAKELKGNCSSCLRKLRVETTKPKARK